MNFIQLCEEVGPWSVKNFGEQPPDNPLLGVLEEIGEISHSYLKSLQGIRGTESQHLEAMQDGIGDALVFLADFCCRAGLVKSLVSREYPNLPFENMSQQLFLSPKQEKSGPRYFLFQSAQQVGRINYYYIMDEVVSYGLHIEILLHLLVSFCDVMHFNFAECVMTTWGIVKQRDWTKNKQTGVA